MNTALFSGSDLDVVFSLVLTMSLSASWIAAAVLVLRLCLKRAPKWVNVLLWGIVAVRLMLPFSIESPLSLLPRTEAILPAATATGRAVRVPAPAAETDGVTDAVRSPPPIRRAAAGRSRPPRRKTSRFTARSRFDSCQGRRVMNFHPQRPALFSTKETG